MCNITSDFFTAIMMCTARRIARLRVSDPVAADNEIQQAISAMDAQEREIFGNVIVKFIIEGG